MMATVAYPMNSVCRAWSAARRDSMCSATVEQVQGRACKAVMGLGVLLAVSEGWVDVAHWSEWVNMVACTVCS
jgi:hypothetical protein